MCLGVPGQIVSITGKTAVVETWGGRHDASLEAMEEPVAPGDFIIEHRGKAVRKIPTDSVAETITMYEIVLPETGGDPIDCEIERNFVNGLATAPLVERRIKGTVDPHPIVMWELTRACDLHCKQCVSGAGEFRDANELSTYEAYKTIDQIASLKPRELIITGGDPLQRPDLQQLIDYARRSGLDPALVVSPTSLLTVDAVGGLERAGLTHVIFSLDGSNAEMHQTVHGVPGTFAATLHAMYAAKSAGMKLEVNTLVTRENAGALVDIVALLRPFSISRWNVHFLVPVGGATEIDPLTAAEAERVFARLTDIRGREAFEIRVVEAPQYRRFQLQKHLRERLDGWAGAEAWSDFSGCESGAPGDDDPLDTVAALDTVDGPRNFVYISHTGDVRASEFLPPSAGNIRYRALGAIYHRSDLFAALRDPANLHGRCGRCEYHHACGGSRARAWALTGDLFASDPLCAYESGGPVPASSSGTEASA